MIERIMPGHVRRLKELRENQTLIERAFSIAEGRLDSEAAMALSDQRGSSDKVRFYPLGSHAFSDGEIPLGLYSHKYDIFIMYAGALALMYDRHGDALEVRTSRLCGLLNMGDDESFLVVEDFGNVNQSPLQTQIHPQLKDMFTLKSFMYFRGVGEELIAGDFDKALPQEAFRERYYELLRYISGEDKHQFLLNKD